MRILNRLKSLLEQAHEYAEALYNTLQHRADATMELVDALAGSSNAKSVIELSQEECYRRSYSSIVRSIDELSRPSEKAAQEEETKREQLVWAKTGQETSELKEPQEGASSSEPMSPSLRVGDAEWAAEGARELFREQGMVWTKLFSGMCPPLVERRFRLVGIDATTVARVSGKTVEDRGFVHQASTINGQPPVTIGHQASMLAYFPEPVLGVPYWALPINVRRISTSETPVGVAHGQLAGLSELPEYAGVFTVCVADSGYGGLAPPNENVVVITRLRINRVGRKGYATSEGTLRGRGRPKKYAPGVLHFSEDIPQGEIGGPDLQQECEDSLNGKRVFILVSRWVNVYLDGVDGPCDAVKIERFDEAGKPFDRRPLLLSVQGELRGDLSLNEIYESYTSRFKIEGLFRVLKGNLLFDRYQTPDVQHEENWWWIVLMAYWRLYTIRELVDNFRRPWDRKAAPSMAEDSLTPPSSPSQAQRGFKGIFKEIRSPSRETKLRGKSRGRSRGAVCRRRPLKPPVKKEPKLASTGS
jgi:hypothetical protein